MICCGGLMPFRLASSIAKEGDLRLILIENIFDDKRLLDFEHKIMPIGKVGKALGYLKEEKVEGLFIIGNMNMPDFKAIKPDMQGAFLIGKILASRSKGDDSVLRAVGNFFETNGIKVLSPLDFLPKTEIVSKKSPSNEQNEDILFGVKVLDEMSHLDIGQSVAICCNRVIGIEAIEGTDEMIKRCKIYNDNGRFSGMPILVKMSKKTQDIRLDTPTIGLKTIENLHESGFIGIAISENVIISDPIDEVNKKLDEYGIFCHIIKDVSI
ncbi:hypothetical protein Deia_00754 [Candidatus Deianiraea vastatrix]|uniref:Uncharacterized protein n=2 Tax=Candidatus Deianiraea vastatrix TaxID=2163644 RepID=A0A5B8XHA3_9RICK|nr:hypothetical protein Deia_00754 [Candidatus Deianiraea vastatrix]